MDNTNWQTIKNIVQIISGILAILVSLWGLYKIYKRVFIPLWKHIIQVFNLADKIQSINKKNQQLQKLKKIQDEQLKKKIDKIFYQVSPNSGKSIKDLVTKLSSDMQKVNDRLTSQQQRRKIKDFNSSYPIFQINKKGQCVWSNKMMQIWSGRSHQQLSGQGWILTIHENERQKVQKQWYHAIEQQRPIQNDYNIFNPTTNQKTHIYCRGHIIKDNKGNLKNYIVVLTLQNDQLINDLSGSFDDIIK